MSDAYQCDRCKEYKDGKPRYKLKVVGRSMNADYPTNPQLCRDCADELENFLTMEVSDG